MSKDFSTRLYMIIRWFERPPLTVRKSIAVRHGLFHYYFRISKSETAQFKLWLKDQRLDTLKLHDKASVGG
ncbi:MAG: hypothetical protein IMZ50_09510 [Candidatus Atribacteria bacterium]|nr:hypothetical protein [Candidatus Atribacteria bacterium]